MTAEPHNATVTYPGGLRARWRWGGSGQGPAVFALSEAGGSLVDLGALVAADPEPLCRAELRLEGPRGAWTARFASAIFDEPRAAHWDDAGLLVPHLRAGRRHRRGGLVAPVRDAHPGPVRVVTTGPCPRPVRARDVRHRAGRDRRLADRPLGCRDGRRAGRWPARAHRLRRPGPFRRPGDGARGLTTDGRDVDERWITQRSHSNLVDEGDCHARRAALPFISARRGRATLTAAIASTPTCRVGSFGPFAAPMLGSRP